MRDLADVDIVQFSVVFCADAVSSKTGIEGGEIEEAMMSGLLGMGCLGSWRGMDR